MPNVEILETDKCEGVRAQLNSIQNPSWDDVRDAIVRLDGLMFTTVCVSGNEGNRSLFVGGGNYGFYNVFIAVDIDREFHNLINPNAVNGADRILVTGGQPGRFQASHCVDQKLALQAAKHFYETGTPDANLNWQVDK